MTKKHFIELANRIRSYGYTDTEGNESIRISDLADWLQTENPRFKRDRWLGYIAGKCGSSGSKVKHAS